MLHGFDGNIAARDNKMKFDSGRMDVTGCAARISLVGRDRRRVEYLGDSCGTFDFAYALDTVIQFDANRAQLVGVVRKMTVAQATASSNLCAELQSLSGETTKQFTVQRLRPDQSVFGSLGGKWLFRMGSSLSTECDLTITGSSFDVSCDRDRYQAGLGIEGARLL